jgi:recombination protein RecT
LPDNALVALERQLAPLAPRFSEVLGNTMPVERLIRTVVVSVERLPKLLECDRQSLFNAAMSAAVLGLEVDGVTGQAYLIPFKGKAQLVIGYKGFNTLAARSGITISGAVVREGDQFDYELGSHAYVKHVPKLGNLGRIVGAWACATATNRPAVVQVMGIDELAAVKARSPGAQRSDSPWNDPNIGFPAMCEKTVKRRLARAMPLNIMQLASRIDEAVDEQGAAAWVTPDRSVVVEGEVIADREPSPTPTAEYLIGPESAREANGQASASPAAPAVQPPPDEAKAGAAPIPTAEAYVTRWHGLVDSASKKAQAEQLAKAWNDEKATRKLITWPDDEDPASYGKLVTKVKGAIEMLREHGT